jgi:hypothetical protein
MAESAGELLMAFRADLRRLRGLEALHHPEADDVRARIRRIDAAAVTRYSPGPARP